MRPGITPEEIENATFSVALRGYDRIEVEAFLADAADVVRALQETSEQAYLSLGEDIGELLQRAKDSADAIAHAADGDAEQTRETARSEAAALIEEAEQDAARLREEAEKDGGTLVEEAEERVRVVREEEGRARERVKGLREELDRIAESLQRLEASPVETFVVEGNEEPDVDEIEPFSPSSADTIEIADDAVAEDAVEAEAPSTGRQRPRKRSQKVAP